MIPQAFQQQMCALLGDTEAGALCTALSSGNTPTSIRTNPFKPLKDGECLFAPVDNGGLLSDIAAPLTLRPVPWCSSGSYLSERPTFAHDPLWHAGAYYVQEAASMFIAQAYKVIESTHADEATKRAPLKMLDLCAAPGGKSTLWRSLLPDNALLVANEPMRQRAQILAENLTKWGHPHTFVTQAFPDAFTSLVDTFDIIATDVPCSGEGMFRKDPNAIDEWSLQNVEKCTALQRSIIEDIWPCLREGGLLVYSTCTFNAHENEENVEWIAQNLGADFIEIEIKEQWNITGSLVNNHPVYRFIPGLTSGEGLFMTVLRKHGDSANVMSEACASTTKETARKRHKGKERQATPSADIAKTATWLQGDFTIIEEKGSIRAIPTWWTSVYNRIKSSLYVIHAGITIGNIKGRDVIPDTSLALSTSLNTAAFPSAELSYTDALNYLRKEAITVNSNVPTGFVIVTYRNQPLGFVKNIGNRANNLYPQEWKIKTSHLPDNDTYII